MKTPLCTEVDLGAGTTLY